ncbi:MAG: trimethylamine methyltransferase family protein [Desulfosarcinaceae bacterium]|nr:trimethylamine methyltransferase family protein [Desulfosarcinaceae bacterium]
MAELKNNWLKFLNEEDIRMIDTASRQVLSEVGIRLEDEELTAQLLDKGCTNHKARVQFPSDVIDAALADLPNEVIFGSRSGKKLHIREGSVATHTGGSIPYVYDLDNGKKRDASLADLENMLRLMNHLENLSMCGGVILPQDVPSGISELVAMATVFRFGQKPASGTAISTAAQARYVVELYKAMADAVPDLDDFPILNPGVSPESPLYYPEEIIGVMKPFISAGIPTLALVAPILGLTAPMTVAGGLAQMNASLLAYAVISHTINPAAPVIYGSRLSVANMRTAHSVMGVPEVGITGACSVQMARHYGLPSDVYGYSSTACAYDPQLGAETAVNGLLPLLAGANVISGFGSFGSGYMSSFEDLVFDNEFFAMNLHAGRGMTVDADHLAVDVIAAAMDGKEYFLQQHTLKHLRTGELYQPKIGLYSLVKQWEDEGSKDLGERAREEVRRILAANEDTPLPEEVEREFQRILQAAEKELT